MSSDSLTIQLNNSSSRARIQTAMPLQISIKTYRDHGSISLLRKVVHVAECAVAGTEFDTYGAL